MQGVLRQSLPTHPVDYNGRCFWSADGGNLTMAKELCNDSGGTIFTFNTTSEASNILDALNICKLNKIIFVFIIFYVRVHIFVLEI
jgi:hypothetical protein